MLTLRNITKDYLAGDMSVHALRGVSISFRESEFVSILGPSGCGKTTLLQAVQRRGGYIVDCDALYYELLASEEGADLRRELQTAFPAAFEAD